MSRCSRADLQAQCAIKPWLSATHNNAINAGYGGSQAFDNDDG